MIPAQDDDTYDTNETDNQSYYLPPYRPTLIVSSSRTPRSMTGCTWKSRRVR